MCRNRLKSIVCFWIFKSFQTVIGGTGVGHGNDHGTSFSIRCNNSNNDDRQFLDRHHAQRHDYYLPSYFSSLAYTRLGRLALPIVSHSTRRNQQQDDSVGRRASVSGQRHYQSKNDQENVHDGNSQKLDNEDSIGFYGTGSDSVVDNGYSITKELRTVRPAVSVRKRRWRNRKTTAPQDETNLPRSQLFHTQKHDAQAVMARHWSQPIVPVSVSFDEPVGGIFCPDVIDSLAISGFEMATQEKNDWIEWKMHESTRKILEKEGNDEMTALKKGEVLVYIGKVKCDGHGSHLPLIKTKSILPMSSKNMADLLMDSSRVKIYNKMSVGRSDLRILDDDTKVVCNLTRPPVAKTQMVSVTLMHSRKLDSAPGPLLATSPASSTSLSPTPPSSSMSTHLVVSRAMPGMLAEADSPGLLDLPRNDILLGVNLLQDLGPNECLMTAVTHVYSPALPSMLAKSMGVSSAINFVRDIRKAAEMER